MIAQDYFPPICLEGFLYGLYSGLFAVYLQCQSNNSSGRTATIVFYAICLLYVLSTATFVSDLVTVILELRVSGPIFSIGVVQVIVTGCCDFLAQCILIYRCWIVWGQNIRVVIIPSFLAVLYLATWVAAILNVSWGPLTTTSFIASIAVNILATGLIVFRIFKVFLEVKAASTSVERSLGSAGGTKFRHIIFVIVESGMTLLVIQLVRIVLELVVEAQPITSAPVFLAVDYLIIINQMFNGITPTIILVRISIKLSFDDEESLKEAVGSLCFNLNNPPSNPNTLQPMGSMLPHWQESKRNEDICSNNTPSDPNTLGRVGSGTSSSSIVEF